MQSNYLLIGGSYGIGLALANRLSRQGHRVVVMSRTMGDLPVEDTIAHHTFDALSDEFPKQLLPETLHGMVYLPGSIELKSFQMMKTEQFREAFELNCMGAVKCLKAAYPSLKNAEKGSSVVLFSTVAVSVGMPFHAAVAMAKGAIEGLTRSLAAEWAPHIRVNAIAPSLTDTPLAARLLANDEKRAAAAARHPLKKIGDPAALAALAAFLLSEDAAWLTGQIFHADGGLSTLRT